MGHFIGYSTFSHGKCLEKLAVDFNSQMLKLVGNGQWLTVISSPVYMVRMYMVLGQGQYWRPVFVCILYVHYAFTVMLQSAVVPVRRKRKRQSAAGRSILSTVLESSLMSTFSPGVYVCRHAFVCMCIIEYACIVFF